MKYKNFDIPDKEIDALVDKLEISIAEACDLWLTDHDKEVNPIQEEMNTQAHLRKRRYEQSEKPRKKMEKERKVDEDKAEILGIIHETLEITPDLFLTGQKNEVELYFEYKNNNYTLKLTKHRPKK